MREPWILTTISTEHVRLEAQVGIATILCSRFSIMQLATLVTCVSTSMVHVYLIRHDSRWKGDRGGVRFCFHWSREYWASSTPDNSLAPSDMIAYKEGLNILSSRRYPVASSMSPSSSSSHAPLPSYNKPPKSGSSRVPISI